MSDGGPAWSTPQLSALDLYLCYGDRRILENNYG